MRINARWRAVVAAAFLALVIALAVTHAPAAPVGHDRNYNIFAGRTGPMIDYTHADFAFRGGTTIPVADWSRRALPDFRLLAPAREAKLDPPQFWARIRFDKAIFGTRAIALNSDMIRDDFVVHLNGLALYRSRGERSERMFGWNHPLFVSLPPALLHKGINEIVFQVETAKPNLLGIGTIRIGPDADIRYKFNVRYFVTISAPQIVSGYLFILTIGALSFWAKRPKDRVYGWMALVGVVWIFRNLHYFVQAIPFDPALFWTASTDSIFVLMAVVFGFATTYFALPRSRILLTAIFTMCVIGILARHHLVAANRSEFPSFLLTAPVALVMVVAMLRACLRKSTSQNWMMFGAIMLSMMFSYHDMLFSFSISKGNDFFLQPFGGLLIFAAFDISLTSRLQNALIEVEDVNMTLEARVADVTASLAESEAARAELQVARAIGGERERIMRDIHDGIGSSLLTALANAKHRNESPDTIATLTRSLTDLRIGVDSLEPIGGDVVALLANLRHRMERELKGAGLAFVWKVNAAPPLTWLDPVGALHILRILQEAIGNALLHSEGANIEVRCGPSSNAGAAGILIEIADNGTGFDQSGTSRGKGLANMAARAEALNALFLYTSAVGAGTTISIWLPLKRPEHVLEVA